MKNLSCQQHDKKTDQRHRDRQTAANRAEQPGAQPAAGAAGIGEAPPLVSLVFEWPEAVGAAVFARAGFVWVAFDKRAPIDLAPLREAEEQAQEERARRSRCPERRRSPGCASRGRPPPSRRPGR